MTEFCPKQQWNNKPKQFKNRTLPMTNRMRPHRLHSTRLACHRSFFVSNIKEQTISFHAYWNANISHKTFVVQALFRCFTWKFQFIEHWHRNRLFHSQFVVHALFFRRKLYRFLSLYVFWVDATGVFSMPIKMYGNSKPDISIGMRCACCRYTMLFI